MPLRTTYRAAAARVRTPVLAQLLVRDRDVLIPGFHDTQAEAHDLARLVKFELSPEVSASRRPPRTVSGSQTT